MHLPWRLAALRLAPGHATTMNEAPDASAGAGITNTIRNLDVQPGDELTFIFSSLAVLQDQSVNFMSGDTVLLHLIVRASTDQVVANDRRDGSWGRECVLSVPPGQVQGGCAVTVVFSEEGTSLNVPGAPPLTVPGRFAVQGNVDLHSPPSISLRINGASDAVDQATDDGFVDYFAECPCLGGMIFGGWVRRHARFAESDVFTATFDDGQLDGSAALLLHERPDITAFGLGYVLFLPGALPAAAGPPRLQRLTWRRRGVQVHLRPTSGIEATTEEDALQLARSAARAAVEGQPSRLAALLRRPLFLGQDTFTPLGLPAHVEVDELIEVRPGAAYLIGWKLDPQELIASIHLRRGPESSPPLADTAIRMERNDIVEAFSERYGVGDTKPGFLAYGATSGSGRGKCFLEIRLADGRIAFKPLPRPLRSGMAAMRRVLDAVSVPPDELERTFDTVLGPPVIELNRHRLSRPAEVSEVVFGTPPAEPRISIVIPLYGRLDFMRYQLGLFSEGGVEADELIYVLDEPSKKAELLDMAHGAHGTFGVPFRTLLLSENRGFGPASNIGMRHARGRYVCFLNSDVFPERTDFFDRLAATLGADPGIGAAGGLLLFADGSVQHAGMTFEALPQFARWLFPMHPGKGRVPAPANGKPAEATAITGACMLMPRELALDLGGFDEDYVIGDFEDADLCQRIKARGLRCVVDDAARAYHLERQSQGNSADAWRRNVTLLNAWTFNRRFGGAMAPPAIAGA